MTTTLPDPSQSSVTTKKRLVGSLAKARLWLILYGLMMPTMISMAVFGYLPKIDVFRYAFYEWIPNEIVEFTGLQNFQEALSDKFFWISFKVCLILLVANLFKMWPSIFTAIVLHRMKSDRARYIYQVLFVIPMVIPGLVWLLIWKSFFNANVGIFNQVLRMTGLMNILDFLDRTLPGMSVHTRWFESHSIDYVFGSVWGMALFAGAILMSTGDWIEAKRRWILWTLMIIAGFFIWGAGSWEDKAFAFDPIGMVRFVGLLGALGLMKLMLQNTNELTRDSIINWIGFGFFLVTSIFVALGHIWPEETKAFIYGRPGWLGNQNLIIPSLILWGFPWVGIVGVMIYLAGLQNISDDVYEAAELDGVGPVGKLFQIELPLMMTQVRINLIFMTMGTLTGYGLVLILLGPSGGPGGVGTVPGLYMYQQAFINQKFGYACALGLTLFCIIMILTVIYQKYVKVEK